MSKTIKWIAIGFIVVACAGLIWVITTQADESRFEPTEDERRQVVQEWADMGEASRDLACLVYLSNESDIEAQTASGQVKIDLMEAECSP